MSVGGLFSIGTSALQAAYAQLQATGHNIANADTPGYTRQRVELATSSPLRAGGGFVGRGVDVVTVARLYDRFLSDQVRVGTSVSAADSARSSLLGRLESLIGIESSNVGASLDDFRLALADLVNRPSDGSARAVVTGRAAALAERLRGLSAGVEDLAAGVDVRLAEGVTRLNGLLGEIAVANEAVARQRASGQPANDLMDRRDALVAQLSGLVQVSARPNPDGTVNVFGAGGHGLVVGGAVARLSLDQDPLDPRRSMLMLQTSGNDIPLSAAASVGGELGGLLRFRDSDLAAARDGLGQLAGAVAAAYNSAHALGVDASGAPGGAMFTSGAPSVGSARDNAGSAVFSVSVDDASALAASDHELAWDGAQYTLRRMSDGETTILGGLPAVVDGLRIDLAGGVPAAGDRFLVRSASVMAAGFDAVRLGPQRIATGLAATASASATNAGDVLPAEFSIVGAADPDLTAPVILTFDGAGTFSVSGSGTGNPAGLAYVPGMTVSYNGWSMTVTGNPAAGDTVTVQAVTEPAADNRNARALLALGDAPLVDGQRFTGAWGRLLADVGQRSEAARSAASLSAAVLDDGKAALGSVSGVNLDEEAARLLQFQQSYQAAAKVIAAAQSVFDTLLSIGR